MPAFVNARFLSFITFACAAVAILPAYAQTSKDTSEAWSVRGVVKAEKQAMISSELVAQVKSLPFKDGQSFRAGDTILEFDCRRYLADLRAAEAEVETARVKVDTNKALKRHNAVGAEELEIAIAKFNQAVATRESLSVRTDQCVIKAPFDGRVVERKIFEYEMPEAGAPLIKIVKDGNLELDLIVPSHWLVWLRSNQVFTFKVDEIGSILSAEVLYVGAVIDPISKTAIVTAKLLDAGQAVRPGMSGTAHFSPPNG